MKKAGLILLTVFLVWSCTEDGPSGPDPDDFDREAILVNWSDNIIIPSFAAFTASADTLHLQAQTFTQNPDMQSLAELRAAWKSAYLSFQHVSMFEMGKAMELRFRDNLNIYPTDTTEIKDNIQQGGYDLQLPSLNNSQGFPALDYLLNGLGSTDQEILSYYTTNSEAQNYRQYLTDLTTRIQSLGSAVHDDWSNTYRDEFISNSGNGANASLDMMVNDFIYYYEKYLRAGKIGIPAGVFSGTPLPGHTEAYYSDAFSRDLFMEGLDATQHFFNGEHYGSTENGQSLDDYLDFLNTMKESTDLTALINTQFDAVRIEAKKLKGNFSEQIETDNSLMLSTYDKLQQNVVYLKVDMLQALNINVDYVDADGD